MKGIWTVAAALLGTTAGAAGVSITVNNPLEAARPGAVIAVPFAEIARLAPQLRMYHVIVRDPKGRALTAQITNYQHDHRGAVYDDLVFSYDFAAGEKRAVFTLQPTATATPPDPPCVYARLVPERLDDMAWENDRIAHRMYGFALNSPAADLVHERLRGSGIDVWGKRVSYPIVDRWYQKGHDQFHKDGEGEGLDLYSIGGSRGAGGTGLWDGKKLWTSDNFASSQVLLNGPRRAVFKLTYAPWGPGAGGNVAETKTFTVDCGVNFDQVVSDFDFEDPPGVVAVGITEHPQAEGFARPVLTRDPGNRWMSLWEENPDGGLGVAVILAYGSAFEEYVYEAPDKPKGFGNHLLTFKARDGVPVRYYTGAGWTGSGQFKDRAAWEAYVKAFAAGVEKPLTISVSAAP